MTVRAAHPTHRWNHQTAECRLCGIGAATRECELPCGAAPEAGLAVRRSKKPRVPNIHAAALDGAKDLVRK